MITHSSKNKLNKIKKFVPNRDSINMEPSYEDVISSLLKNFEENHKSEFQLEPKFLTRFSFDDAKLNVSYSLEN